MSRGPSRETPRDVLRGLGLLLLCAKVALVPLVFDVGALVVFAHPKALLSHGLSAVLFAVVATLAIRQHAGAGRWSPAHVFGLAYACAYVVAAAFALDRNLALFGAHDRSLGLVTALDGLLLAFAALGLVRTRRELAAVGVAMVVSSVGVLAYEAVQLLGLDPIPWASGFGRIRPFSTLGNAGVLAQYLGTLAPAAFALALLVPRERLGLGFRIVLLVLGGLLLAGAVLSGTRAVLLGLGAAAVALALWVAISHPERRVRVRLIAAVLAAVSLGGALIALSPLGRAAQAMLVSAPSLTLERTGTGEGSVSGRLVIYDVAWRAFLERPLTGVGPDNFVAVFPRFRPAGAGVFESDAPQTSPHSWLARLVTDAGVAGLLSFVALLVAAITVAIRGRHQPAGPIAGAGVVAAASFLGTGLVSINDVGSEWLLWLALAAALSPGDRPTDSVHSVESPTSASRSRRRKEKPTRARPTMWPAYVLIAVAFVPAALQMRALDAAHAAETARQLRVRGSADAIASGLRAVDLDPLRAEYWNGLGLALTRTPARLADAERSFARAVDLAPYQAVYLTNLARAQFSVEATRPRAVETARRAVAVDPNLGDPHYTLALALLGTGNAAEAAAASERAAALQPIPKDPYAHEIAARAYLQLGRPADAERWLRQGLTRLPGLERIDTFLLLARALAAQGRVAEAMQFVESILNLDPTHAGAVQLRRELEAAAR